MKTKRTVTTAIALAALTALSATVQAETAYIRDLVVVQVLRTSKPASGEENGGPFGGCMARVVKLEELEDYANGAPLTPPIPLTGCASSFWASFDCHGINRDPDSAEGMFEKAQSALVTNWRLLGFVGPLPFAFVPTVNLLVTNDYTYNGYCRADRIDVVASPILPPE